jgi:hypothetical protein
MSEPLEVALQSLETYRAVMRRRYAADRVALAELLRQILAGRTPKKATALVASLGYDELLFQWDQGSRSPSVRFQVTGGVIPNDSAAFAAMSLSQENFTAVNSVVLTDLVLDAWSEAGGYQAARPLAVWRTLVDSPGAVPEILTSLRDTIRQLASKRAAGLATTSVPVPAPSTLPAIRDEHLAACHAATPTALREWAAALDAEGCPDAASVLKWLEEFRDRIAPSVAVWIGHGQGLLIFRERADTWWSVGEEENSTPGDGNPDSAKLGEMLAGWADFYSALEWFFRALGYTHVRVRAASVHQATTEHDQTCHLAGGEHFAPLPLTAGITEVHATATPPEE